GREIESEMVIARQGVAVKRDTTIEEDTGQGHVRLLRSVTDSNGIHRGNGHQGTAPVKAEVVATDLAREMGRVAAANDRAVERRQQGAQYRENINIGSMLHTIQHLWHLRQALSPSILALLPCDSDKPYLLSLYRP